MLPENINQFQQKLKKIRLQERKYIPEPFSAILQAFFMPLISCLCESWIIDLIKTTLQPERCCNICQALGIFFQVQAGCEQGEKYFTYVYGLGVPTRL